MPEIAEAFILSAQLAQVFAVPLETDSRLKLPDHLRVSALGDGPYDLIVHDSISLCGDESIAEDLQGAKPVRVQHQGKKMWVLWKGKKGVLESEVRLGMTGGFTLARTTHTRLEFKAATGSVFFNDIRKFGGIVLGCNAVAPSATARLNVDQVYHDVLKNRDSTLKEIVTDQTWIVSGIGNYVVNEACFTSGMHPDTHVGLISGPEFATFLQRVKSIARESAALGGCTLRDFKDLLGREGTYQNQLKIYGKKGNCPTCNEPISVLRRPNETTSWVCQKCQPLRRLHPVSTRH
jgi:formamidopyrimidine-DNA glycosylase